MCIMLEGVFLQGNHRLDEGKRLEHIASLEYDNSATAQKRQGNPLP